MNHIIIYNKLINEKIYMIIKNRETITRRNKKNKVCIYCNNFKNMNGDGNKENVYIYKGGLVITDLDIHYLEFHNLIRFTLYEKVCNINIDNFYINFLILIQMHLILLMDYIKREVKKYTLIIIKMFLIVI